MKQRWGTHIYVSGSVKKIRIKHTPENMVRSQNTHLHETPATAMYPPTIGPSEGPAKGASVKKARAFPRVLASQISDIIPLLAFISCLDIPRYRYQTHPLFVSGAAAKVPPIKRKTRIEPVLGERAQPT